MKPTKAARELGQVLAGILPPGQGFALLLFDFGDGGHMTYLSNGEREDMLRALRELLIHLEGN